jgi:Asp-tRNA(Asn)/Glu-tRNA(Gln) amidotransferase A subunit family amidase
VLPSERKLLGWTPLSVVGPMGRTMEDMILQLRAGVGLHAGDPLSYPVAAAEFEPLEEIDLSTLRVAYTEDFGVAAVDDTMRQTFRAKIAALSREVKVCEPLELDMGEADRCFDIIRAQNFVAGFQEIYERDPDSLGSNTRTNYEMGRAMSLADVVWAHAEQTRLFRRFQQVFDRYDVIVSPTTPVTTFPWSQVYLAEMNGKPLANYYRWLALTYLVTLATNPAISLPCGTDYAGMPFGMQMIGAFRGDARLLDIAQSLEMRWERDAARRRVRPDLAKLAQPVAELKSIVTAAPGV